jgi:hypothetical protein
VNIEHVKQPGDLRGRLNHICGQLERLATFSRPPLSHEIPNAPKPPLAIKNRELGLTFRLIDNNWDKDAMFGNVFLELIKLIGIEQMARIVEARFDFVDRKLEQHAGRDQLGDFGLCRV